MIMVGGGVWHSTAYQTTMVCSSAHLRLLHVYKILSNAYFRTIIEEDPHIMIHNVLQKYCHRSKKRLYGCFVDFSKAFDSVPRDILLSKLKKHGINGKIFNIIQTIYLEDTVSIKIGNKHSSSFKTNKGVR